jgi:GTP-binding protein Era
MLLTDQHPLNRSIMIALLGKPNAGKSSLINTLMGFDLTIVSAKPQTTRNQFHCAFTIDHTEIVLVDTPGIHKSNQELNKRMNGQAIRGAEGADINCILIDLTARNLLSEFKDFIKSLDSELGRTWVLFTKTDISEKKQSEIDEAFEGMKEVLPTLERYIPISIKDENNIHILTGAICDESIAGPHLYPRGDISNKNERFFVSEYIREQTYHILKDELPYECAVTIEEFRDFRESKEEKEILAKISATILVNRPSQRAIVVGRQGSVIKEIGTEARKKIEAMIGGKVFLNLHVKVKPKWFKNNFILEELGLPRVKDSTRVWRANR